MEGGERFELVEVEGVINSFLRVEDECVVYGVEIPKNEGKAGMAKIVFNRGRGGKGFDVEQELEELFGFVERNLPKYMWPVFLRVAVGVGGAGAKEGGGGGGGCAWERAARESTTDIAHLFSRSLLPRRRLGRLG